MKLKKSIIKLKGVGSDIIASTVLKKMSLCIIDEPLVHIINLCTNQGI